VTRADRYGLGKALRTKVPRASLGHWRPPSDRPDPVELINASQQGRVDALVSIRVGRMIASPYGFLRGTAVVMAEDVARLPSTGITPVVCGDSHLGNSGFYPSPEQDLVIDLNDFDEAHPGGWERGSARLAKDISASSSRIAGIQEERILVNIADRPARFVVEGGARHRPHGRSRAGDRHLNFYETRD
jgi:uncharacterized protein (DUF2252 family)